MKKKTKKQREADEGIRWLWTIGGAVTGYVIAELVLRGQPHPWHWLATLLMGAITYLGIMLRQNLQRRA